MMEPCEIPIRYRKSTTIYLCDATMRRLKIHAAIENRYVSDVIRALILNHIPDYESQIKEGEPSLADLNPSFEGGSGAKDSASAKPRGKASRPIRRPT